MRRKAIKLPVVIGDFLSAETHIRISAVSSVCLAPRVTVCAQQKHGGDPFDVRERTLKPEKVHRRPLSSV